MNRITLDILKSHLEVLIKDFYTIELLYLKNSFIQIDETKFGATISEFIEDFRMFQPRKEIHTAGIEHLKKELLFYSFPLKSEKHYSETLYNLLRNELNNAETDYNKHSIVKPSLETTPDGFEIIRSPDRINAYNRYVKATARYHKYDQDYDYVRKIFNHLSKIDNLIGLNRELIFIGDKPSLQIHFVNDSHISELHKFLSVKQLINPVPIEIFTKILKGQSNIKIVFLNRKSDLASIVYTLFKHGIIEINKRVPLTKFEKIFVNKNGVLQKDLSSATSNSNSDYPELMDYISA